MKLTSKPQGNINIVTVEEARIDAAGAIQFKDAIREVTENGLDEVILDLSHVQFIDSSGLGAIVAVMKILTPERTLALACLTKDVSKVFTLTRMDRIFKIHDQLPDQARKAG